MRPTIHQPLPRSARTLVFPHRQQALHHSENQMKEGEGSIDQSLVGWIKALSELL
jgi:hypothetical protein